MINDFERYSQIVKRFTKVNIIENQAEAIAKEIIEESPQKIREFISYKIKEHSSLVEARIEGLRADLLKWFIGVVSFQTIVLLITISIPN